MSRLGVDVMIREAEKMRHKVFERRATLLQRPAEEVAEEQQASEDFRTQKAQVWNEPCTCLSIFCCTSLQGFCTCSSGLRRSRRNGCIMVRSCCMPRLFHAAHQLQI